jgi:hypothetical protein
MRDLNIDYIDLYKKVDRFIRDANGAVEGVTLYIEQMEKDRFNGSIYVETWDDDLKMLKRLRWIRNQLSHEADFDSDICKKTDYDWLKDFYDRLMSASDPTAMLYKAKAEVLHKSEEQKRRLEEERRLKLLEQSKLQKQVSVKNDHSAHETDDSDVEIERVQLKRAPHQPQKRKTFWQRIKDFFFEK